ncbi:MAG: hypothetical protein JXA77_07655 [Bacteroidales bacterium]|nr:hypothetical protein [Bacteroidales bacterium]MBN2817864.1 hypothetical protein [Bacteroidales bacterium]
MKKRMVLRCYPMINNMFNTFQTKYESTISKLFFKYGISGKPGSPSTLLLHIQMPGFNGMTLNIQRRNIIDILESAIQE